MNLPWAESTSIVIREDTGQLWKSIGCIILVVNCQKKGFRDLGRTHITDKWNHMCIINRYVHRKNIYTIQVVVSIILIGVPFSVEIFYFIFVYPFLGCVFEYLPFSLLYSFAMFPWLGSIIILRYCDPRSFYYPSVKGVNIFWRVQGLVDAFSKLCRNIILRWKR